MFSIVGSRRASSLALYHIWFPFPIAPVSTPNFSFARPRTYHTHCPFAALFLYDAVSAILVPTNAVKSFLTEPSRRRLDEGIVILWVIILASARVMVP